MSYKKNSKAYEYILKPIIKERHRHRYEMNIKFEKHFLKKGLIISGKSPDGKLPEIVELKDHPWFIGVQFHPELLSRPLNPHPLFNSLIKTMFKKQNKMKKIQNKIVSVNDISFSNDNRLS